LTFGEEDHELRFEVEAMPDLDVNPQLSLSIYDGADSCLMQIELSSTTVYKLMDKDDCCSISIPGRDPCVLMFSNQSRLLSFEKLILKILESFRPDFVCPDGDLDDEDMDSKFEELKRQENMLLCINLVKTKLDKSVRRGAIVKSLAVCSRNREVFYLRPVILQALTKYFDCEGPEEQKVYLETFFSALNNIDLTLKPVFSEVQQRVYRAARLKLSNSKAHRNSFSRSKFEFAGVSIPLSFPVMIEDDEVDMTSVKALLQKFDESIMDIYNAIVSGRRILFLGHNEAAADVCKYTLSACLLVSPPLRGILKRVYPYAHLSDIGFLETKGYIAGVTNPIFQQHTAWWDVLCDITTGSVTINSKYQEIIDSAEPDTLSTALDSEFVSSLKVGLTSYLDDEWFRCQFRDYTQHVLDIMTGIEQYSKDSIRMLHTRANTFRIAQFKASSGYQDWLIVNGRLKLRNALGSKYLELRKSIRALQVKRLAGKEVRRIFSEITKTCVSNDELLELLSLLPESQGGLFPLAVGLFHSWTDVKNKTFNLLHKLDSIPEGSQALNNLNYFLLLTYHKFKETKQRSDEILSTEVLQEYDVDEGRRAAAASSEDLSDHE